MITVIDYGKEHSNPIGEILNSLGVNYSITRSELDVCRAKKIILPDAKDLKTLSKKVLLFNAFNTLKIMKKPVLGINLGMVLMCEKVNGTFFSGLGNFPVPAESFESLSPETSDIILNNTDEGQLLKNLNGNSPMRFIDNYYVSVNEYTTSIVEYRGKTISASLQKDNFYGVQFNPELSGDAGIKILENFLEL